MPDSTVTPEEYRQLVARLRPRPPVLKNAAWAFVVGGSICLVGQAVLTFFLSRGMTEKTATTPTVIVLIGLGALLTGLGWYDRLSEIGGMGATLPITGFANAMVAPAMEFKPEGFIMGVGARLFTVAGPVLVYGMAAAFVVSLIRLVLTGRA